MTRLNTTGTKIKSLDQSSIFSYRKRTDGQHWGHLD
jgi:hypothetical protein